MTEKPLAIYRPVFVLWVALLHQLPWQLFFTFAVGVPLIDIFAKPVRSLLGKPTTLWDVFLPYIIMFCLIFILYPIVVCIARAMNYRTTVYRVYADRLEIEEGFLTIHAKRLMFRDVREVSLRRGVLQRGAGLGSVYLATQATGNSPSWNPYAQFGMGSTFGSGALIRDIPEAGEAYERLRGLMDAARRD
ncbi:PH domain-containing protein [Methylorubrum salsuginis]|uniref:PH domain-containing protein n=1 Tax=Methylorubrum salsuginis TaxID=414703 RepID=A0A1I4J780_9HYPH|nr:PH domain-containing protein [Methylorubrum salsuginis]SFL62071.1 PH domain-containing protein [Methylorubrum salsuginis]